jgi:hypothetical protein
MRSGEPSSTGISTGITSPTGVRAQPPSVKERSPPIIMSPPPSST